MNPPRAARLLRRAALDVGRRGRMEIDWLASRRGRADVAIFHEFSPAPAGGGHQFLRALLGELERRGLEVELNTLARGTPACLVNSFNFDPRRLRRFVRSDCRVVHRVDGPIGAYRGFDDGTDAHIAELNEELADVTILQSRYSLDKHRELGIVLRDPVVVPNTVDPAIFHPPPPRAPIAGRCVRVIATSWSDNVRKGADTLAWLDEHLDHARYRLTFVGRTARTFANVQVVGPVASKEVARLLREHDVYLAPSRDDPCSNALLEALACGLPAVFRESGGHPELVGDGGVPFFEADDIPGALDKLVGELDARRAAIAVPPISDVADRYLVALGIASRHAT